MLVTSTAREKIESLFQEEKTFRVKVVTGGCNGFSYQFLIDELKDGDIQVSHNLVVDPGSYEFLKNATLDYVSNLGFAGFKINNPDTRAKCGCGMSFDL